MVAVSPLEAAAAAPAAVEHTAADRPALSASPQDRAIDPAVPTAVSARPRPPPPGPDPSAWHDAALRAEVQRLRAEVGDPPDDDEDENDDEDEDEYDGPPRGVGMIVTGGVLLGPGTLGWTSLGLLVNAFSDGFCIAHCAEESEPAGRSNPGAALFVVAGLSAAAGIGLLILGIHRHTRWRAWQRERTACSARGRLDIEAGGVSLRF